MWEHTETVFPVTGYEVSESVVISKPPPQQFLDVALLVHEAFARGSIGALIAISGGSTCRICGAVIASGVGAPKASCI